MDARHWDFENENIRLVIDFSPAEGATVETIDLNECGIKPRQIEHFDWSLMETLRFVITAESELAGIS